MAKSSFSKTTAPTASITTTAYGGKGYLIIYNLEIVLENQHNIFIYLKII